MTAPHRTSLLQTCLFAAVACLWLAASSVAIASDSAPPHLRASALQQPQVALEIVPGHWGNAAPAQIHQLLTSVAATFLAPISLATEKPIAIRVLPRGGSPRVLYERGVDGEYLVHLSARDQHWYQYVYQFSHELCHILSNFDHKERQADNQVASDNQWFEESLCETASLFTLRRLAEVWERRPPSRNWVGYAPVFADYADYLLAQKHRQLPLGASIDQWYAQHRPSLQATPYLREKNELVASRLLGLFEQEHGRWQAITYLNRDPRSAGKTFADYLRDWQAACPPRHKGVVRHTLALFGLDAAVSSPRRS